MTYVVEKTSPRSEFPHLTDETFECATPTKLADRLECLTGWSRTDCDEIARAVARGSDFGEKIDSGVEVVARRV